MSSFQRPFEQHEDASVLVEPARGLDERVVLDRVDRGLEELGLLELDQPLDEPHDIRVGTILPSSIDTPIFEQAANYTGQAVKPLDPIYEADKVAGLQGFVAGEGPDDLWLPGARVGG
jgi:hypothetical protein